MKKAIALCMCVILSAILIASGPVAASDDRLTVTVNGENALSYRVGDEIVFYSDLDTGDSVIINGHVSIEYDPDCLELLEHTGVVLGKESMEAYSFSLVVYLSGLTLNADIPGTIIYNFSNSRGLGTFTDDHTMLSRFRFRVKSPGTTDIQHTIITLCDYDEKYIYHKGVADEAYHPVTTFRTMIAEFTRGDVDGNGVVDNRDALILDRYIAGWKNYDALIANPEAADLNEDGRIGNRDAIMLDRYIAGWQGYDQYITDVVR